MTQRSVTYLKGRWETGDIPTQTDYQDLMDSFVSLEASANQTMSGPLTAPSVSAASVSANFIHIEKKIHNGYQDLLPQGLTQGSAASADYDVTKVAISAGGVQERGIVLSEHHAGRQQYLINDAGSVTAATIYPSPGCNFIGTAANGGMLVAAGQTIQVIHVNSSAYSWVRY